MKPKKTKNEIEADFFERFDPSFVTLSNMVRNETRNLVKERKIKQSEVHNYTFEKAPTSGHVYKIMVVDESKQLYPNVMHLFRVRILIPPSAANVERGYAVMNLLCSSLRLSLNQTTLERLMRTCINGPESLSHLYCHYLLH